MPSLVPPNPTDPALRLLTAEDADRLAELHALSFSEGSAWSAETFTGFLEQSTCVGFALEAPSPPIGFALFQGVIPEAELLTLCTHPNHRKAGYAQTLMSEAEAVLKKRGMRRILLEVSETNHAAIRLYETLGFICISTRDAYYSGGEGNSNALVMAKEIAGQA